MVIGAGWAGARAMTATSGPGLDLMAEFAGLAYFAEVPAVIWDVQRIGPSTGLPTRTSQGDISAAYYLSHGDTRHVLLFPADPAEAFEFGITALDLAERLQTLVIVLSDLDLGMNVWISAEVRVSREAAGSRQGADAGAAQGAAAIRGAATRTWTATASAGARCPARRIPRPPTSPAAPATPSMATYSERPEDWENNLNAAGAASSTPRANLVPAPVVDEAGRRARIGIISLGSNHPAIVEARDLLAARRASRRATCGCVRCRSTTRCASSCTATSGCSWSRTTSTASCTRSCCPRSRCAAGSSISVARCNGMPLTAVWIAEQIQKGL